MSLTREQFYNKAIRPKLAIFSTDVKVEEILPHLPCLTFSDKEEIEAKKGFSGNYIAMQKLLDNLRRRENWPDEFIAALRNCEHEKLANEMSAIYDSIRGISNAPRPVAPPAPSSNGATATVTTATIHTVPQITPPLLIPPAGAAPVHSTTPETQKPSPVQVPETQQVQQVTSPAPAPSPEPVSQATIIQPVIASSPAPPPAVVPSPAQQEATTNTGEANNNAVLNSLDGLGLTNQASKSLSASESPLSTTGAQASNSNTSQIQLPFTTSQSLENIQVPIEVKDMDTSVMLPVQDTNPPLIRERTFQRPEEISDSTEIPNEVVQRNAVGLPVLNAHTNSTRTPQATTSAPTEGVAHMPPFIEEEYFSKPLTLQLPEPQQNRAGPLPVLQEDPCSTASSDLEISREPVSSIESRQTAAILTHNQPEEDHYESVCESQTLVNVIRVAEEPPAENLNGQPPSMLQRSRVMSEEPPTLNHVGTENAAPSGHVVEASNLKMSTAQKQESNAGVLQPEQREEGRPELFRINNVQMAAAAGIALAAVFLAWRLKQ